MTQAFIVRSVRKIAKPSVTSACLSVCQYVRKEKKNSAATVRIFMKFEDFFFENLSRNCKFHSSMTRITVLYMKTWVHL